MTKKLGILFILAGLGCLMAAAGLLMNNRMEEKSAQTASRVMLEQVQEQMTVTEPTAAQPEEPTEGETQEAPLVTEPVSREMPTTRINGYECIGILTIPALNLELPVLTQWSYDKLKVAPCHYYGDYFGSDFVIAAHNYPSHFGKLNQLRQGDVILFTDVTGEIRYYEVQLRETLPAIATEEMIASGFDLSLYTCTPGGKSRVTVRCNKI